MREGGEREGGSSTNRKTDQSGISVDGWLFSKDQFLLLAGLEPYLPKSHKRVLWEWGCSCEGYKEEKERLLKMLMHTYMSLILRLSPWIHTSKRPSDTWLVTIYFQWWRSTEIGSSHCLKSEKKKCFDVDKPMSSKFIRQIVSHGSSYLCLPPGNLTVLGLDMKKETAHFQSGVSNLLSTKYVLRL